MLTWDGTSAADLSGQRSVDMSICVPIGKPAMPYVLRCTYIDIVSIIFSPWVDYASFLLGPRANCGNTVQGRKAM